MASNPSVTQFPPGVELPHEPAPSSGQLPAGEGCYNCDHDFGDIPLSQPYRGRSKRSVSAARVEEIAGLDEDEVMRAHQQRLVEEGAMSVGSVVRSRRSADRYFDWRFRQVSVGHNNNNNNNRIQRRYSRFFTISSQRRELSPTRTLKWPRRSCVQITCNTSSAYHVQHVALSATWYEGTAQLLSLTDLKLHLFELIL